MQGSFDSVTASLREAVTALRMTAIERTLGILILVPGSRRVLSRADFCSVGGSYVQSR